MSCAALKPYLPRKPEETILYQTIRDWYPTFKAMCEQDGRGMPHYIQDEFESYLRCGQLYYGFTRRQCQECRSEHLLPFSCKKRGFCPGCCGRRAVENVIHLTDNILPFERYRQWVVTLPINIRYLISSNSRLQGQIHALICEAIDRHYIDRAKAKGIKMPYPGAVTFVQRFGSALNLNIHYHILYLDGVYYWANDGQLRFRKASMLTDEDLATVMDDIRAHLIAVLQKWGYLSSDHEFVDIGEDKLSEIAPGLAAAQKASTVHYIGLGERAGTPVRRIGRGMGYLEEEVRFRAHLCVEQNGISIHAATVIRAHDRKGLERLVSYMARAPLCNDRLEVNDKGEIIYRMKRRFSDGSSAILLSPLELLEKLAALVPTTSAEYVTSGMASRCGHHNRNHADSSLLRQAVEGLPL